MIKGFVTGSFRPFHKGHEALIDYAKSNCDHLTILITTLPDETIPYKYRLKWVLSTYLDDPKVDIVADVIEEPAIQGDGLSGWWGSYVKTKFGQFDRVFTSEDYGEVFARSMGAVHWKFNQSRTIIPVSATLIRQKPVKYWDYINNFAKDYFVKKIAIVGTESTGKTTMAQQLANYYSTVWAPEMGRELVPNARTCTVEDLELVASEHAKGILRHTRRANKVLFLDTDLNITQSYSEFLFNKTLKVEPWIEKANEVDFYIYLDPTAPWVDDGTRLPEETRNKLAENHWKHFKDKNNWSLFSFDPTIDSFLAYGNRFADVVQVVDEFLAKY